MKFKKLILICLFVLLSATYFNFFNNYQKDKGNLLLSFDLKSNIADNFQVFYMLRADEEWSEEQSINKEYSDSGEWKTIQFEIPADTYSLRLDMGGGKASQLIKGVYLIGNSTVEIIPEDLIANKQLKVEKINQDLKIETHGEDPYIIINNFSKYKYEAINIVNLRIKLVVLLFSLATSLVSLFIIKSLKDIFIFLKEIFKNRHLILNLAKNDFKTKYVSSYLGIVWGFIQPLLTIATYWFVFQVGLRSGDVSEAPFILWFLAGIIPWFFFSDALSGATNVYTEYSYLVKKVVFKVELLPVVKIVSVFFVHLFFLAFIFVIYAGYGYLPSVYSFQLAYYVICSIALVFSISLLTSAIVLFFKDLNQIIIIILQMGFWFTPIGWPYTMLSDFWINLFKLNPMFYIVEGFRDTFINKIVFIDHPYYTFYFWMFCLAALTLGIKIMKKMKPHFADVL